MRRLLPLLGAAICLALLVLPAGAAAPDRSLDGGLVIGAAIGDAYDLSLPAGAESVVAGDSLEGEHEWGASVYNNTAASLDGVQVRFDSDGSGNDYTDSSIFGFSFRFTGSNPNTFVTPHTCAAATATEETCPSPVALPSGSGFIVNALPGTQAAATPGFDASRTMAPVPPSPDEAVSIAMTLEDSRYAGGQAIQVQTNRDDADPGSAPTLTVNGQPLPDCPQSVGVTCADASEFGAYQHGSATCESVSMTLAYAQLGEKYAFGWDENETTPGCPTGEPGVTVNGFTGGDVEGDETQAVLHPCDAGTDCSLTQTDPGLGDVTLSIGSGQAVTGFKLTTSTRYSINFPAEGAPSPPGGTVSAGFGSSTTSNGTATASNDGTTASATGAGGMTVSQWGSDPVTSPPFMASGQFFDVEVLAGSKFPTLTLKDCNLGGGNSLEWWDGIEWKDVVPDSPPLIYDLGPPACLSGELSSSSSPTVDQLRGTIFAVVNAPIVSLTGTKLVLSGSRVRIPLRCARVACRGTATLEKTANAKSEVVVLGRVTYALAAGKKTTVAVTLNRAGKTLLARVSRKHPFRAQAAVSVRHGSTLAVPVRISR